MIFEWDEKKAKSNQKKHGVTFREASTVFGDPLSLTIHDPLHSDRDDRYVTIGVSSNSKTLVISHTDNDETIRIISARFATTNERKQYEEGF